MDQVKEGVVKFEKRHTFSRPIENKNIIELNEWRRILKQQGLIGQNSRKYNGVGYGNLSKRLEPYEAPVYNRRFLITGTQTGYLEYLTEEHYSIVLKYHPEKNLVISEGPIEASSESMTHGTIYDISTDYRYVFHVHSSDLWRDYKEIDLPNTLECVKYGTPEMAKEVRRLFKNSDVKKKKIFAMLGHEDGIISFGKTAEEAGEVIIDYLSRTS
ncbi:MAG: class II aldolase/adducin family protein [Nanoarchaeota archaeon]